MAVMQCFAPLGSATGRLLGSLLLIAVSCTAHAQTTPGVTGDTIRIGSVMDLEGDLGGTGRAMKAGLDAALKGANVHGRAIELVARNDFYDPPRAVEATKQLIEQGVFLMLGNVGSPTSNAVLPLLAENKIPAIGFLTGASFMGTAAGDILNFRPNYSRESANAVKAALTAGVKPAEICVYAQNDAYGMSGVEGVRAALAEQDGAEKQVALLDQILAMTGPSPARNNIGPVGVYERNTLATRDAYESLKNWEASSGTPCKLIVSVGIAVTNGSFIGYAHYKKEPWIFVTLSPASGEALRTELAKFQVTDGIIATQIVPPLDTSLPIITEARAALGERLTDISLEGYIVGKLFLTIMNSINGEITRDNFMRAARSRAFDLGGLIVDFQQDRYGSDNVYLTRLDGNRFVRTSVADLKQMLQ